MCIRDRLEARWMSLYIVYKFVEVWFSNSGDPFAYFCTHVKKIVQDWHIWSIISEYTWPILTKFFALVDMSVRIINPTSFSRYNSRDELEYCHVDERINSVDDAATSCKHLLIFGSVNPEITLLICVPWYGYWTKIGLPIFIRRAGIPKRIGPSECRWAH